MNRFRIKGDLIIRNFYEDFFLALRLSRMSASEITTGEVQIFFQVEGLAKSRPANRLSDGSLRYLCSDYTPFFFTPIPQSVDLYRVTCRSVCTPTSSRKFGETFTIVKA